MVTIERNVDGRDTGHEMLQEYGEEVMSAGWNPQLVLAAIGATERISHYADDRGRTVIPESIRDFAPPGGDAGLGRCYRFPSVYCVSEMPIVHRAGSLDTPFAFTEATGAA